MKNPPTAEGVEQREDEASVDPRKRVVFRERLHCPATMSGRGLFSCSLGATASSEFALEGTGVLKMVSI